MLIYLDIKGNKIEINGNILIVSTYFNFISIPFQPNFNFISILFPLYFYSI